MAKIENGEKIRAAFANEPPFAFKQGNDIVGEAPAIHRETLKGLGVKEENIEFKLVTNWDALIPGLGKSYEMVCAGMAIIPDRCQAALFSEPEYITMDSLLVKKGNPKDLKDIVSFKDNPDVKLGVMKATSELNDAEAIGVPEKQIEIRPDLTKLTQELKGGRIDAIALTTPTMVWAAEQDDELEALEPFITQIPDGPEREFGSAGGAVFHEDDKEFRDAINGELKKIKEDKEKWLSLVGDWGFGESEYPPSDVTSKQLCGENYQ